MTNRYLMVGRRGTSSLLLVLLAGTFGGCYSPPAEFRLNAVHVQSQAKVGELSLQQRKNVKEILLAEFGTPDEPQLPALGEVDISRTLSMEQLRMAAGPVGIDDQGRTRGLYREHCAHCHGITGDGAGPTAAFLNPYPRDFRRGTFKFKSTPADQPPTFDDLKRTVTLGIPGTAMPSFSYLPDDQIEALINYAVYLSIRGQVERNLIFETASELGKNEVLLDQELTREAGDLLALYDTNQDGVLGANEVAEGEDASYEWEMMRSNARAADANGDGEITVEELAAWMPGAYAEQHEFIKSSVAQVVENWQQTTSTPVPAPPENWGSPDSIHRGQQLFFTSLTNCSKCHGDLALGDGQTTDYDEWTQDWTVRAGINPLEDRAAVDELIRLGALEPRNARPRNLRQGIYRGGRRPIDLYWRVKNGIAGTPMPKASDQLSSDEIWHVIAYVRSLPYDPLSRPEHLPSYQRERL